MILSIIIPVYNSGSFLLETIESIENAKINYPFEIIIIDDKSTDETTINILSQLKLKGYNIIFQKENKGPSVCRNVGIKNSKGKYILPFDSDDLMETSVYNEGIKYLEENLNTHIIYFNYQKFQDSDFVFLLEDFNLQKLMINHLEITIATLFRKEVWEKLNGFDENMIGLEDWEFWLRCAFANFKFKHINKIAFKYRFIKNNKLSINNHVVLNRISINKEINEKHSSKINNAYLNSYCLNRIHSNGLIVKLIIKKTSPTLYNFLIKKGVIEPIIFFY